MRVDRVKPNPNVRGGAWLSISIRVQPNGVKPKRWKKWAITRGHFLYDIESLPYKFVAASRQQPKRSPMRSITWRDDGLSPEQKAAGSNPAGRTTKH